MGGSNFGVPTYPLGVPTYTTMKRLAPLKLQASGAKKPLFLGSFWRLYRSRFPHRDFFETFFVKHTCPHIKNKKIKKRRIWPVLDLWPILGPYWANSGSQTKIIISQLFFGLVP